MIVLIGADVVACPHGNSGCVDEVFRFCVFFFFRFQVCSLWVLNINFLDVDGFFLFGMICGKFLTSFVVKVYMYKHINFYNKRQKLHINVGIVMKFKFVYKYHFVVKIFLYIFFKSKIIVSDAIYLIFCFIENVHN